MLRNVGHPDLCFLFPPPPRVTFSSVLLFRVRWGWRGELWAEMELKRFLGPSKCWSFPLLPVSLSKAFTMYRGTHPSFSSAARPLGRWGGREKKISKRIYYKPQLRKKASAAFSPRGHPRKTRKQNGIQEGKKRYKNRTYAPP